MTKTLLLVDDDRKYTDSMKGALEAAGYRVVVANSAREGMEAAVREKPDAMLLDIMMPGRDGGALAQDIRNHKTLSDVPMIFLTSLMKKGEMGSVRKKSAITRCVAKTADFERLVEEIEAALAGKP